MKTQVPKGSSPEECSWYYSLFLGTITNELYRTRLLLWTGRVRVRVRVTHVRINERIWIERFSSQNLVYSVNAHNLTTNFCNITTLWKYREVIQIKSTLNCWQLWASCKLQWENIRHRFTSISRYQIK
jgi:hypothetical protein